MSEAPFPHCDSNVLHAPGECRFCDMYPERQRERIVKKINFTGHYERGFDICPSEIARPLGVINQWGGNRAHPERISIPDNLIPQTCTRSSGHDGPCNGYPRQDCRIEAEQKLRQYEIDRAMKDIAARDKKRQTLIVVFDDGPQCQPATRLSRVFNFLRGKK